MKKQSKPKTTSEATKLRHRIVLKEIVVNGSTAKAAMKKAGYSKSIQEVPSKVLNTKSFRELMDEEMPDKYLTRKHKDLLDAKVLLQMHFPEDTERKEIKEVIELAGGKLIRVITSEVTYPGKAGKDDITVIKQIAYYTVSNTMAQDKALDKAYKLRGDYAAEKKDVTVKGFSLAELFTGDYDEEE